ncbi:MAG: hypothetical protein QXJ73_08535 [Candidatus Caldarchaeum sp.]
MLYKPPSEVWPEPDEWARRRIKHSFNPLDCAWYIDEFAIMVSRNDRITVTTPVKRPEGVITLVLISEETNLWPWPPIDKDVEWKAASALTAARKVVKDKGRPLDPVGFKALYNTGVMTELLREDPRVEFLIPRFEYPSRIVGPATCFKKRKRHNPPEVRCRCGFHAARSVVELTWWLEILPPERPVGLMVVTPVGRTIWHSNAWRAESYQVHAAIVPNEWDVPEGWNKEVPVVKTDMGLVPWKAYQIAEEVKVMIDIWEEGQSGND